MVGRLVKHIEEVKQADSEIRDLNDAVASNLFFNKDNLRKWVNKKQLFLHQTEKSMLLWRDRTEFLHLFFCTADREEFKHTLKNWLKKKVLPVCIDLLAGKDDDRHVLADCGFTLRCRLRRMCSIRRYVCERGRILSDVDFARVEESEEIVTLLQDTFDSFSEQIPDMDEVKEDINKRNIVVSRDEQGKIAAIEYFNRMGQTLWLRFWATKAIYRERGLYGAIALKKALDFHGDARRVNLWVREDNVSAINVYENIGFSFDGLEDEVFLYTP